METFTRADGQTTRTLVRRNFGRYQLVVQWFPPKLYTRFDLFYGRDPSGRDWAVMAKIGRLELGLYV